MIRNKQVNTGSAISVVESSMRNERKDDDDSPQVIIMEHTTTTTTIQPSLTTTTNTTTATTTNSTTTTNTTTDHNMSAPVVAPPPTTTNRSESLSSSSSLPSAAVSSSPSSFDFIGNSISVKDLFTLPYTMMDRSIAVAVHNLGGTLLIDTADPFQHPMQPPLQQQQEEEETNRNRIDAPSTKSPQLSIQPQKPVVMDDTQDDGIAMSQTLTVVVADLHHPSHSLQSNVEPVSNFINSIVTTPTTTTANRNDLPNTITPNPTTTTTTTISSGIVTSPDDYAAQYIPPVHDPREYLSWNFRGMQLLVGSDAMIYRNTTTNENSSNATQTVDNVTTDSSTGATTTTTTSNVHPQNTTTATSSADQVTTSPDMDTTISTTLISPTSLTKKSRVPLIPHTDTRMRNNEIITTTAKDVSTHPSSSSTASNAIVVRVEEVHEMQSILQQYHDMRHNGTFIADHQLGKLQQMGKLSYADAVVAAQSPTNTVSPPQATAITSIGNENTTTMIHETSETIQSSNTSSVTSSSTSFAAPDLDRVQLQTCIVPVPSVNETAKVEGYLSYMQQQHQQSMSNRSSYDSTLSSPDHLSNEDRLTSENNSSNNVTTSSQPLNPVSTVLDTYLDNIMANVPQLALCLREKGFIQSVKLLNTEEIPSRFLQASTFNASVPFETIQGGPSSDPADEVFSPQIMEMNAQALLRFLKTNCMKDNATYLLRRDVGHTNLQLYDISSISAQRQQKWIWWLAMISYRFSNRLKHLSQTIVTSDPGLRRSFRVRQRSLLHNTLDMLETLADMNGNQHESLIAAVCENLADTYLVIGGGSGDSDNHHHHSHHHHDYESSLQTTNTSTPIEPPPQAVSSHQPYGNISVDALGKAQDHLTYGIKVLTTVLQKTLKPDKTRKSSRRKVKTASKPSGISGFLSDASDSEDDEEDKAQSIDNDSKTNDFGHISDDDERIDPVVTQLFGMHQKLVNVSLRLAEIHLKNYWSSSAMQNLRVAGQKISESLYLTKLIDHNKGTDLQNWIPKVEVQYAWLWEQCGHFARSFAADVHWRDRGHASGDDVVSVLQDVDLTFSSRSELLHGELNLNRFANPMDTISIHSKGAIGLQSLTGVLDFHRQNMKQKVSNTRELKQKSYDGAIQRLENQKMLQRDERRVLVAAAVSYSRAVHVFDTLPTNLIETSDKPLVNFLRQRLGDACNEIGKVMLNEVRSLLTTTMTDDDMSTLIAEALCSSAEFWFLEGLHMFEVCGDLRNLALLRCNLCQCYKFRANATFVQPNRHTNDQDHAESCLQEATHQLQAAHEALEVRDTDPLTWDMVSAELAATLLVLGVRRRQSLIGSGNMIMILQALRLAPGKERSIVDPMLRALNIYEGMGQLDQAAAAHYQLAQYYTKIWTCQRDEVKTREKLAAAFQHYEAAHSYYLRTVRGNEATFCLLCLDLASLFTSVPGGKCLSKALCCYVDTRLCFSSEAIDTALSDLTQREVWFPKFETLANNVDERLFKLLKNLVKIEEMSNPIHNHHAAVTTSTADRYKNIYRVGLQAKMTFAASVDHIQSTTTTTTGDVVLDATIQRLYRIRCILDSIQPLVFGQL